MRTFAGISVVLLLEVAALVGGVVWRRARYRDRSQDGHHLTAVLEIEDSDAPLPSGPRRLPRRIVRELLADPMLGLADVRVVHHVQPTGAGLPERSQVGASYQGWNEAVAARLAAVPGELAAGPIPAARLTWLELRLELPGSRNAECVDRAAGPILARGGGAEGAARTLDKAVRTAVAKVSAAGFEAVRLAEDDLRVSMAASVAVSATDGASGGIGAGWPAGGGIGWLGDRRSGTGATGAGSLGSGGMAWFGDWRSGVGRPEAEAFAGGAAGSAARSFGDGAADSSTLFAGAGGLIRARSSGGGAGLKRLSVGGRGEEVVGLGSGVAAHGLPAADLNVRPSGVLIGLDPSHRPVVLALFRRRPLAVGVVGELRLAQILALRCAAVGARVVVETARQEVWDPLVLDSGLDGSRLAVQQVGRVTGHPGWAPPSPTAPLLVLRDCGARPPYAAVPRGPWTTVLTLLPFLDVRAAGQLAAADLVGLQRVSAEEAAVLRQVLGMSGKDTAAMSELPESMAVWRARGRASRYCEIAATGWEDRIVGEAVPADR